MKLFEIINLNEFMNEYQLWESTLVDYCTGYDSLVYLLFSKSPPERIGGMFCNTIANAEYTVARIHVNWTTGKIASTGIYVLGTHRFNYHYVRPFDGDYLLLGARCHYYSETNIEQNALIVDEAGNRKQEFCLGDGIEDCITTDDGKIITSYYDEGIFGNFGWEYPPIGAPGLIVWDAYGSMLWKNDKYEIHDCYAVNMDESEKLWFYYYDDFKLVRTDFNNDIVIDPEVSGMHAFSISENQKEIILSGGYYDGNFYCCKLDQINGRLGPKERITLELNGQPLKITGCYFRGSKLLFVADGNVLCGAYFE